MQSTKLSVFHQQHDKVLCTYLYFELHGQPLASHVRKTLGDFGGFYQVCEGFQKIPSWWDLLRKMLCFFLNTNLAHARCALKDYFYFCVEKKAEEDSLFRFRGLIALNTFPPESSVSIALQGSVQVFVRMKLHQLALESH